ncbi:preprotein translocase subunit SecE [uncultured Prevotella sp.]|uniref:preprotein translocase subunit SecE n=1 Tax=uncultured Prevotella sp. TaxID=159272 RepID=UPI0025829D99|nr:preprotein translocase subunit SecE [uncultured Prevotella sp.]
MGLQNRGSWVRVLLNYCKVCYDELAHKVTWPTMKELTGSAVLVLTASVIIALVVFGMDLTFEKLMSLVYPG